MDGELCYDCARVPFGEATVDECGMCDDDPATESVDKESGGAGGHVTKDDIELLWIADEALQADDPEGWDQAESPNGDTYYIHAVTQQVLWQHPLDYTYQQKYLSYKNGGPAAQVRQNLAADVAEENLIKQAAAEKNMVHTFLKLLSGTGAIISFTSSSL